MWPRPQVAVAVGHENSWKPGAKGLVEKLSVALVPALAAGGRVNRHLPNLLSRQRMPYESGLAEIPQYAILR